MARGPSLALGALSGSSCGIMRAMLARVTGTLESVDAGVALVAVGDLAYEALLPTHLAESLLLRAGEPITLHTIEHLEAVGQGSAFRPRLLGFASRAERAFFERLTRVKGLGTRRTLRAMARPAGEIAAAITRRDTAFLQSLPEIGTRLAETVVAELHGKVDEFGGPPDPAGAGVVTITSAAQQAVAALERLGQSRAEAERLVSRAVDRDPALDSPDAILAAAFTE